MWMLKLNGPGSGHMKMTESRSEIEGNARKFGKFGKKVLKIEF